MAKITYQYKGIKNVPAPWNTAFLPDGTPLECTTETEWYDGSEEVSDEDAPNRVNILNRITDEYGMKKYRNISVQY